MKRMRHCFNCGAELGEFEDRHYDRLDHCGDRECAREAADQSRYERQEAHDQLDRDMDW